MSKEELLEAMRRERAALLAAMQGISDDVAITQPIVDAWTLKDLLGHIAAWNLIATQFLTDYLQLGAPVSLGLKDDAAVNAFNAQLHTERRDWNLARVRAEFDAAFRDFVAAVEKLNAAQLNAQLPAPWGEGDNLVKLIAVNSYEHEPEHTEQIQKCVMRNT